MTGIPSSKRQAKSTVRFDLDSLFRRVLLSSSGSGGGSDSGDGSNVSGSGHGSGSAIGEWQL